MPSPGVDDCTQLLKLSEDTVVDNLQVRYAADEIHTFVGSMLVVVNPYKQLPRLYDEAHMATFAGVRLSLAPPHVFALAEEAYTVLVRNATNQCIVISGESGAGKTESAKHFVRYISWRARKDAKAAPSRLSDALVRSNPSLEAFGNASTSRNANSSRFAKFIRLHIGSDGELARVLVVTYLLEKSRVTSHVPGDRNFHIFYALVNAVADGAPSAESRRKELLLPRNASADAFPYLRAAAAPSGSGSGSAHASSGAGGGTRAVVSSDLDAIAAVLAAGGLAAYQTSAVLRIISAVLQLGCVSFAPAPDGAEGSALADDGSALRPIESLIGLPSIAPLLLERRLAVAGLQEQLTLCLTPAQCAGARDALARALYELTFLWVVRAINRGLGGGNGGGGLADGAAAPGGGQGASEPPFIGLLDIFGFEDFGGSNGFEQLCINFANERLQQFLIERVFKAEARLYHEEGVPLPVLQNGGSGGAQPLFSDNAGCVELIGGVPSGIFRLLDSQCISPQATDAKFCASVNEQHLPSPFLRPPTTSGGKAALPDSVFKVRHYAGDVCYSAFGFVGKNSDSLDAHVASALARSTEPLIKELLELAHSRQVGPGAGGASKGGGRAGPGRGGLGSGGGSLSRRFVSELEQLVSMLSKGGAHFARCVAPSGAGGIAGEPMAFDRPAVARQLRADGTFDAVRLMKAGYPVRVPFAALHAKFLPLLDFVSPEIRGLSPALFAELLAAVVGVRAEDATLGSTRIFLRGKAAAAFDELRARPAKEVLPILKAKMAEWEAKEKALEKLRPRLISWSVRFRFLRKRRAAIVLQSRVRGARDRERAHALHEQAAAERRARRRPSAHGASPGSRQLAHAALDEAGLRDAEDSLGELAAYVFERGSAIELEGEAGRSRRQSSIEKVPSSARNAASIERAFGREIGDEAFERMRATLASRDWVMLENEVAALVARARAEEEAQELGHASASKRAAGHTAQDDATSGSDRRAVLRDCWWHWDSQVGSQELVVLEAGHSLPLYRRVLKRQALLRLRKVFDEWDTDHDGKISLSEFFVVMKTLRSKMAAAKKKPVPEDPPGKVEAMFEWADVDGSGGLDFPEFLLFSYKHDGLKKSTFRSVKKSVAKRIAMAKVLTARSAKAAKQIFNPLEA